MTIHADAVERLKIPVLTKSEKTDRPPQGAECRDGGGVEYRVWAPICRKAEVEIVTAGGEIVRALPMEKEADGYAHVLDPEGKEGDRYKLRLNGEGSWPDSAARWQPEGVHGPGMVIDPRRYRWNDGGWKAPTLRDLVIYELHIGTFTPEGTFRAAIERLPHLRDLGVTAIEIMPIADFPGGRNWGYDGVSLYAPAHVYGHPDDLRALVDTAHGHGLAVILDVVYNHFGPDGNYLALFVGEYLDEKSKTPWGGAIRYGDPTFKGLRDFLVANPEYWMREFHIDGFRIDATHAIFDPSPRHILKEITERIHANGGFAIAEDSRNDSRLILPEELGGFGFDAVWADDLHHTVRVANTHECESYFQDFQGSTSELVETLRHGWLFRGQYSKRRQKRRGTECRHLPPQRFVHCISNHDQIGNNAFGKRLSDSVSPAAYRASSALVCLGPYTPMLFMGQEWRASTPFLFFTEHAAELGRLVVEGRRNEFKEFEAFRDPATRDRIPNPQAAESFHGSKLPWTEVEEGSHAQVLELYRACLSLRKSEAAFRPASRSQWQVEEMPGGFAGLRLQDQRGDWLMLLDLVGGHAGSAEALFQLPEGREWQLVLSTNEGRFGGDGQSAIALPSQLLTFSDPEFILLRASSSDVVIDGAKGVKANLPRVVSKEE